MRTLNLVCLLCFSAEIFSSDAAYCTHENLNFRRLTRRGIRFFAGPAFYIMSYMFPGNESETVQYCVTSFNFTQQYESPIEIDLNIEKHAEYLSACNQDYYIRKSAKLSNIVKSGDDKYLDNIPNVEVYIASLKSGKIDHRYSLLYACKFWIENSSFRVQSSIILLFEGISNEPFDDRAEHILCPKREMIDLEYSFLDGKGLYACDDALSFINDCKIMKTNGTNFRYFAIAFLVLSSVMAIFSISFIKLMSTEDVPGSRPTSLRIIFQVRPAQRAYIE